MTHTDYIILFVFIVAFVFLVCLVGGFFAICRFFRTPVLPHEHPKSADTPASYSPRLKAAEEEFARVWRKHCRSVEEMEFAESAARDGDLVAFARWKELQKTISLSQRKVKELEKNLKTMRQSMAH